MSAKPITIFGPDFPFPYDDWISHTSGIGSIPAHLHGTEVAVIGAGVSGMVASYELMKLGLKPVIYETGRMGGRLRTEHFENATGVFAELGGMRFPKSGTTFNYYSTLLDLQKKPFPNPLTEAAQSTVIDLAGVKTYAEKTDDLPPIYLVLEWDDRTFYDFIATSPAFKKLSFRHREIFGQVGFGTGGWDSDFRNSMLEILRVVLTDCDVDQELIVSGAESLPRGLWNHNTGESVHWDDGISLSTLHDGATRPGVTKLKRTDLWMALDRTSYMQSSKTFVMVDSPFWKERDPLTGQYQMSMTLTDRLTRGTYLFDNGEDKPAVICLTYTWMADALKMLPLPVERRVDLALAALSKIYPDVDIKSHIIGKPITISWEADPNFLGAFKGALPGHYRYNRRMYCHFMQQQMPAEQRGIFIAGDDVSWTPGWAPGICLKRFSRWILMSRLECRFSTMQERRRMDKRSTFTNICRTWQAVDAAGLSTLPHDLTATNRFTSTAAHSELSPD